jgi:hypothetical protein
VRLEGNTEGHDCQRPYCDDKVTNYKGSIMRNRLAMMSEELPRLFLEIGNQVWSTANGHESTFGLQIGRN